MLSADQFITGRTRVGHWQQHSTGASVIDVAPASAFDIARAASIHRDVHATVEQS